MNVETFALKIFLKIYIRGWGRSIEALPYEAFIAFRVHFEAVGILFKNV